MSNLDRIRAHDNAVNQQVLSEQLSKFGVRVTTTSSAGEAMDALLDGLSDRGIEPPGRLSLGSLPPGDYVIELRGGRERRQERIRIVDRDVVATFR